MILGERKVFLALRGLLCQLLLLNGLIITINYIACQFLKYNLSYLKHILKNNNTNITYLSCIN